jgi:xanthine dehydrogenase accessory factor
MDETRDQSPSQKMTRAISQLLDRGSVAVLITLMSGIESVGSKLLIDEAGETIGSLGDTELDRQVLRRAEEFLKSRDETRMISVSEFALDSLNSSDILLLFERLQPALRLVVCGAGHVGAALAKLGAFVGYQTTLIDDRAEFVRPDRFSEGQIELVVAQDWAESVRQAVGNGRGVAIAVVTRGHDQDEECMEAIVDVMPDYVGLIGSKRRTNIVIDNLIRSGASADHLRNIRAPIGLDIGAISPEEVALAIIAEIVAERRGAQGGSLSAWRRVLSDKL